MKDFEGKIIKIYLDSSYGVVCITGPFMKFEDNFLVMLNPITKKIEYYSMYYIKTITIVGDIKPDSLSIED